MKKYVTITTTRQVPIFVLFNFALPLHFPIDRQSVQNFCALLQSVYLHIFQERFHGFMVQKQIHICVTITISIIDYRRVLFQLLNNARVSL